MPGPPFYNFSYPSTRRGNQNLLPSLKNGVGGEGGGGGGPNYAKGTYTITTPSQSALIYLSLPNFNILDRKNLNIFLDCFN